jgi:hypothetical protein
MIVLIVPYSCKHEDGQVPCDPGTVKVTLTKTDAHLNQSDGSITATATGGERFTYSLNGGSFKPKGTFTKLAAGEYLVIAKNEYGCFDTATISIGIIDPCSGKAVTVTATKTDATLNQSNGSITAVASGGTNFTYSIDNTNFQASGLFSNLKAGNYTVVAKSSEGCIGSIQVTIGTADPCQGKTITVTATKKDATLNQSDGTITATATGATSFTYSIDGTNFQTSGSFTKLKAGTYTVTAKSSEGCIGTTTVTVGTIDPCAGVTVTVTTTKVDPVTGQSNGSITATATGGSGFTYSLNNGAFQSSGTFSNLATGNYTVTAKNSNGCTGTAQVSLGSTNPCSGVTIAVTLTKVDPALNQSNGSITATATGGTGFTYSLNNGAYQASGTFSNLPAGVYTVTAKSSAGCLGSKQITLTGVDPCAGVTIAVTLTKVDPALNQSNGSITATATGGTGFTYSLNNGVFQSSGTFSNLAAGSYTVTAKSSTGCLGSKQITLTGVNPCSSVNITISNSIVNLLPCSTPANNGSITVTASGSSGYMYSLNNGTYQSSNLFSNLAAASYTVAVKDANGCTNSGTAVVGTQSAGPLFANVKTLIMSRCAGSGCHTSGGNAAGYNFDNECNIVTYWSQINGAAVTYSLTKMPLGTLLNATEKQTITDWINAGHVYNK